jgi:Ni/Co efflux regulator RcnB
MKRIAIISLAATALVPVGAAAQQNNTAPATQAVMAGAPAPGMSWHNAPGPQAMRQGDRMAGHVVKRMDRRHHGINARPHYRRFDRGFVIPQYWWGPQFQVSNWGMYGLPQPMHGGRWVRYYDDALLIDSYGRVQDGRWGMKWDEWGEDWAYDDRGIPVYVGNGDFQPGEEDYAWVEEQDGAYAEGYGQGYEHGGYGNSGYGAYGYGAYGYPYAGYGYGYGYGGGMVITETTVTTAPTVVAETYYVEEEVEVAPRRAKPRRYRAKPRCNCPSPAPALPGERG